MAGGTECPRRVSRCYGAQPRALDRPWVNNVDESGRCETTCIDSVRIDQWLQAVRITKTRSGAAAACRGGHVRINGASARPSSLVRVGDHVEVRVNQRERIVDVTKLITKRVDPATATECFDDRSPTPTERQDTVQPSFAVRDSGAGRPTKRDRRQIDRIRGHGR
jgi:ribosome-associated heat shock protein Hsp15